MFKVICTGFFYEIYDFLLVVSLCRCSRVSLTWKERIPATRDRNTCEEREREKERTQPPPQMTVCGNFIRAVLRLYTPVALHVTVTVEYGTIRGGKL